MQHVYGPNSTNKDFIAFLLGKMKQNAVIDLTDGTQKRDFLFLSDFTSAIKTVLMSYDKNNHQQIFNKIDIGSGSSVEIKEFVLKLKRITNSQSQINFGAVKMRNGDELEYKADISYLMDLGWMPKVSMQNGLQVCSDKYC